MGTRGLITEAQLMADMPRNPNPNLGFRGDPDGQDNPGLTNYGVYAAPLHRALLQYEYNSDVVLYGTDGTIRSYLNRGWPVVVWVTYALKRATPRLTMTNGVQYFLVPHEHALLAVGYDGRTILANDPWTGSMVRYYWRDFNRAWGYFGNMALAIEPCAMAQPVPSVRLSSVSTSQVTWSWARARNASRYQVTITRVRQNLVVYQGTTNDLNYTLASPAPGGTYEIDVASISGCGDLATPFRLVVKIPRSLGGATPTPTPQGERTVVVTPTPTSTVSPTATSTPTPGAKR
jgi:uncharacterized protein YvpB